MGNASCSVEKGNDARDRYPIEDEYDEDDAVLYEDAGSTSGGSRLGGGGVVGNGGGGGSAGNHAATSSSAVNRNNSGSAVGYRVLGVSPGSPAAEAGLMSFLDFIVIANGLKVVPDNNSSSSNTNNNSGGSGGGLRRVEDFVALLASNVGNPVSLVVRNIRTQQDRTVWLRPSPEELLGANIVLDNYHGAEERLLRVMEIDSNPRAPAVRAGLIPWKDYVLGTTEDDVLDRASLLACFLRKYQDRVVELYVYNLDEDSVRIVRIVPSRQWGGRGLLGADVGTGTIQRFRITHDGTASAPQVEAILPSSPTRRQRRQQQQRQSSSSSDAAEIIDAAFLRKMRSSVPLPQRGIWRVSSRDGEEPVRLS